MVVDLEADVLPCESEAVEEVGVRLGREDVDGSGLDSE